MDIIVSLVTFMLKIEKIIIRLLKIPLVSTFKISTGTTKIRKIVLIEIHSEDFVGYGECPAGEHPYYSPETAEIESIILRKYFVKKILGKTFENPHQFRKSLEFVRGHKSAKTGLEYAFWDLYGKYLQKPLFELYGGIKKRVEVGVSIGIQESVRHLIEKMEYFLDYGYRRIKIKIAPKWDVNVLKEVRGVFPKIVLMVDANGAYTLGDLETLKELDRFDLLMIEQPLHYEDLVDHSILQTHLRTPICLDESISSIHHAKAAIKLKSCKIINIKPPRVGGILESIKIHDISVRNNIGLWIGGMLETGIGKAHLLHIATLPGINYPSDISDYSRYWKEDITDKPLKLSIGSSITVPQGKGLGVNLVEDKVEKYQKKVWVYRAH